MHEQVGYDLMGAAFEVYNVVGFGLAEEVYQQCLENELELRNISFESKKRLTMQYKGRTIQKSYEPDLFVSACLVELKAVKTLLEEHFAQLFNYMRIAEKPVGYLLNFGKKSELEWKRFILSDLRTSQP